MIRTLVHGSGRMAESLLEVSGDYPQIAFVAQVSRSRPDSGSLNPPFFLSFEEAGDNLQRPVELVLDFTLPAGTITAARWCAEHQVPLLSGVTGLGGEANAALDELAEVAPVLWAPNLSFGVNLLASLLDRLQPLVRDVPVTIEEVHHAGKKDAPSGTALMLAQRLRQPGGAHGELSGVEFVSRREGEVVGDHSIRLNWGDETLTLSHRANDRRLFARGALEAGQWLVRQQPGRYTAADWVSLD